MKLIVGLGNPGEKYGNTRHNIGFMVMDNLVKELTPISQQGLWKEINKPKMAYSKIKSNIFLKPLTYMNLSGLAVSYLMNFYKIKDMDLWVVHDDIDLPLGKIRIKKGGSSAGHHGIESIIKEIGITDFLRFRIGIGKAEKSPGSQERNVDRRIIEKYVVSNFSQNEEGRLRKIIKNTVKAVRFSLEEGVEKGMNKFN